MADLTPDEVMGWTPEHVMKTHCAKQSLGLLTKWCAKCGALYPCMAYASARRLQNEMEARETAEARVTALEAVVREIADYATNKWQCKLCDTFTPAPHEPWCEGMRAVELMEGEQ